MGTLKQPALTKFIYPQFEIGDFTYGKPRILGNGLLKIGKFCSIADGVTILLGVEHNTKWATTYPFPAIFREAQHILGHPMSKGPVFIGHDVWIGQNATILSGVTIGNGVVIGAESLVSKNVEPYSIVVGNPAMHTEFRFADEWIDVMQRIAWWNWTIEEITERFNDLLIPPGPHLDKYLVKKKEVSNEDTI
jgi:acetyltransferase-like isoleucine patch superfamily enzyme